MKEEYFLFVGIPETSTEEVEEALAKIEEVLGVEAIREDKYAISMDGGMMSGYLPLFPYQGEIPEEGSFACFALPVKSLVKESEWKGKREKLETVIHELISEKIRVPAMYRVTGTDLTLGFELIREGKRPYHDHHTVTDIVEETYRRFAGEHGEKVLTGVYGKTA